MAAKLYRQRFHADRTQTITSITSEDGSGSADQELLWPPKTQQALFVFFLLLQTTLLTKKYNKDSDKKQPSYEQINLVVSGLIPEFDQH